MNTCTDCLSRNTCASADKPMEEYIRQLPLETAHHRVEGQSTKCGFGLYCVHYFFVGPSYLFAQWIGTPVPALVPVSAVLTFICSWSFTYLVSKLPYAKYIIG